MSAIGVWKILYTNARAYTPMRARNVYQLKH